MAAVGVDVAQVMESLGRRWWTLERFGLTPSKLGRRVLNRTEPRVLCVSVPKAGTHLLERAICLHPRLYRKLLPTIRALNLDRHGGLARIAGRLRPGQVVAAHLHFDDSYPDVLRRSGVSSIFLIRDPRDVVVSEAHYLSTNRDHRLHELFARQPSFEDMLRLVIVGDDEHGVVGIARKLDRYGGWLASDALVVRFEDLIGGDGGGDDAAQASAIRSVYAHLGLDAGDRVVSNVAARLFSSSSPTFRKGAIGSWSTLFEQPEIRELFEREAGPFMGRYGYGA
jgi:hypothetical protein